jgi:CHAD domain-containing protein
MPYRIKHGETVPGAIRRIAGEQIERAHHELCDEKLQTAEAVHQARKRFKKLRSLLRLIRPVMDQEVYRTGNRFFRDQGRALATARDDQVMIDTLAMLLDEAGGELDTEELTILHKRLLTRRDSHQKSGEKDLTDRMSEVAGALERYRAELVKWDVSGDGYTALRPGLEHSYRRGRKALDLASRSSGQEDAVFHEWRKRVKDHWYHSRLLQGLWPGMMKAYSHELKHLSDLLGDDHDLAVFRATVKSIVADSMTAGTRQGLLGFVSRRQQHLRREALLLGRRVYAEKPKRLRKRWDSWWKIWHSDD